MERHGFMYPPRLARQPWLMSLVLCAFAAGLAVPLRAGTLHKPERLTAEGSPAEIGAAVGKAYGAAVQGLHPTFLNTARLLRLSSQETLYAQARQMATRLEPADVEEMKALAQAAGMPYDDVLFLNMFYQLVSGPMCRQVALWGQATKDGRLLHGRNLDWLDYPNQPLQRNHLILNVKPKDGVEYLALTWPGLTCVLTGTNAKGITVAFNQLRGREPAHLAEPTFFTLKRVLRSCGTLEQAVELFQKAQPSGDGSVMISDATQKTAGVVEILGKQVRFRKAEGDIIGNANHATREAGWKDIGVGPAAWPVVWTAQKVGGPFDVLRLREVLAHQDVMQRINLLSVVFEPAANRMFLSCGPCPAAAKGKFVEYELFARPARKP